MAKKSPIDRIVAMLGSDEPEKRMAAAIVLGELKVRGPAVTEGLASLLRGSGPALERHALEALRRTGARRALDDIFPLLGSRDPEVRAAAAEAVASVGDAVVGRVRARLAEATGHERHALEHVLSGLGGKEAFDALLEALEAGDEEDHRKTALELRRQIQAADGTRRRSYRARLEKLLKKLDRQGGQVAATAATVKVLGYLEDERLTPTLMTILKDAKRPPAVRQEALIALRFVIGGRASKAVVRALVEAARSEDRALAQTALMSLAAVELPGAVAAELAELADHPEPARAQVAIDKLGTMAGPEVTAALTRLLEAGDARRAELAAAALEGRPDAVEPLVALLATVASDARARLVRRALDGRSAELSQAAREELVRGAVERLARGEGGWRHALSLAAERDPVATGQELRAAAAALRKKRKPEAEEAVLRAAMSHQGFGDEDRYRLASLALRRSGLDPRPSARRTDPALEHLERLLRGGYDVAAALRRDRSLELDHLYYVGFHFLERELPLGEELLELVAKKGGRKKVARAAKNKLRLARSG